MPVLRQITEEFAASQPFAGRRIAAALHITPETAVLMRALQAGGAQIALSASNPLSTRDDICAALAVDGMAVYATYGEDLATYQRHLEQTLAIDPHLVMDDGADLIVALHQRQSDQRRHPSPGADRSPGSAPGAADRSPDPRHRWRRPPFHRRPAPRRCHRGWRAGSTRSGRSARRRPARRASARQSRA